MPLHEYWCLECGGRPFTVLVGMVAGASSPVCPNCHGDLLRRKVSRFARIRSEDTALDDLAESADSLDDSDPRAVRRFLGEMASGMDDDVTVDDLEALVDPIHQPASPASNPEAVE